MFIPFRSSLQFTAPLSFHHFIYNFLILAAYLHPMEIISNILYTRYFKLCVFFFIFNCNCFLFSLCLFNEMTKFIAASVLFLFYFSPNPQRECEKFRCLLLIFFWNGNFWISFIFNIENYCVNIISATNQPELDCIVSVDHTRICSWKIFIVIIGWKPKSIKFIKYEKLVIRFKKTPIYHKLSGSQPPHE